MPLPRRHERQLVAACHPATRASVSGRGGIRSRGRRQPADGEPRTRSAARLHPGFEDHPVWGRLRRKRTGWDSNPRGREPTRFPIVRLKPLGHPSEHTCGPTTCGEDPPDNCGVAENEASSCVPQRTDVELRRRAPLASGENGIRNRRPRQRAEGEPRTRSARRLNPGFEAQPLRGRLHRKRRGWDSNPRDPLGSTP